MGRPYSLTTRDLFEMAQLIRHRKMTCKDIAKQYGINQRRICKYFTGNGDLTDYSLILIKKELLAQIRS